MPARSVIIADNNEFYRHVLGDFYREMGFSVRVASEGIEALTQLKQSRPDLMVLDLIMPRLDGAHVCSFIKSSPEYHDVPVIILSGILADEIDDVPGISADAYIAKMPIEQIRQTLREVTDGLLSGRKGGSLLHGFEKMYRREVVLELLQDRKSHQDILDSLSEGIVELSSDGRLLVANSAFHQIVGRPGTELVSSRLAEVFPRSGPVLDELFARIDGGAAVATAIIQHAGRELQLNLHHFAPFAAAASGEVLRRAAEANDKVRLTSMLRMQGYTMLMEDITDRVKVQREREDLRARLAQSEKLSAIGLFASGAAHELNNPLTSVLGYSQLLLQKGVPEALCDDLQKITEGADRCRAIVESLTSFAQGVRPGRSQVDLNELIMDSISVCKDRLREEGIDLEFDLAEALPGTLANAEQLRQALVRIVENSYMALKDHEGPRVIRAMSLAERGCVRLCIEDTGPGIPHDLLGRVFDPFFTTREVGKGAGLGLSVAYGIVTGHGGSISASNRPGGGARVTIELPITALMSGGSAEPREPPHRVSIVDDEAGAED